ESLLLYPLAFGLLVCSRAHGISRTAMVPELLDPAAGRDGPAPARDGPAPPRPPRPPPPPQVAPAPPQVATAPPRNALPGNAPPRNARALPRTGPAANPIWSPSTAAWPGSPPSPAPPAPSSGSAWTAWSAAGSCTPP